MFLTPFIHNFFYSSAWPLQVASSIFLQVLQDSSMIWQGVFFFWPYTLLPKYALKISLIWNITDDAGVKSAIKTTAVARKERAGENFGAGAEGKGVSRMKHTQKTWGDEALLHAVFKRAKDVLY